MPIGTVPAAASAPKEEFPRPAWAAVWALALTVAALNTSEMLPASLLTPIAASLGASEGVVGQSVTATALLAIATSLLITRVTRRFDRRRVILVVAAAQVLSNLVVALAPNTGVMLAGRLLLGLTVGGVWGLSASIAIRLVAPAGVARALSIVFGGGSVAMVVASPLGAVLGGTLGWRGVFGVAAAVSAAAVIALRATLPPMPLQGMPSTTLMRTLRLPGFALGMTGVILLFGGQNTFITYLRPFLEARAGLDTGGVAVALLVFGLGSFIGTTVAPTLLRRSLRATLAGAAAVQATALLALLLFAAASPVIIFGSIATWGIAAGTVGVGWSTWLAHAYPSHTETGGGILVAAIQGAMMSGAMIGGCLIDSVGAAGPLMACISVLALGAVHTGSVLPAARPDSA